jgi:hypothetical protein
MMKKTNDNTTEELTDDSQASNTDDQICYYHTEQIVVFTLPHGFSGQYYLPCLYQFSRKKYLDKHVQQPMWKKGWPSILSLSEIIWVQASSVN